MKRFIIIFSTLIALSGLAILMNSQLTAEDATPSETEIVADPYEEFDDFEEEIKLPPPIKINLDPEAKIISESGDNDMCESDKSNTNATTESELAIALGLQWLSNHQLPNGSWSFNHQLAPNCHGACSNPGKFAKSYNRATGMALLSFLGAGVTHKEGKYKKNVYGGISFLCAWGKRTRDGSISFVEPNGTIYSHGIVTVCLCEAYAMTKYRPLLPTAQGALNYITFHQDPDGGGWSYQPQQKGDALASGWQLMALKSGFLGDLKIPHATINKATLFLDSVQSDNGAKYGCTEPGDDQTATAIGLFDRMCLGWTCNNPALQRGVEWLSEMGPSKTDCDYNYYATQVMHQYDGPLWKEWRQKMNEQLISSQAKTGHEKGSWYHNGSMSDSGGRLYDTAISIMTLEVYYQHMSVYKAAAIKDVSSAD